MKIFSILLIIVSTFILNIWLYYTSENYRSFLKNIKGDNLIEEVSDDYIIEDKEKNKNLDLEEKLNNKVINPGNNNSLLEKEDDFLIKKIKIEKKNNNEIVLSDYLNNFLNKFDLYNLVKLNSHSNLLDVTSEYPDDYFEYYSKNLTLYFFPTKNYNEVKEIFEIESDWNFFKINEVDNFWEESFYINLWKEFDDNFVRIIFVKNDNVIWIKISKAEYSKIKNIIK